MHRSRPTDCLALAGNSPRRRPPDAALVLFAVAVAGLLLATTTLAASRDQTSARTATAVCRDCARDSDADGVVDDVDRCPHTRAGAPVSSLGCPHDSDGDGVHDYRDRCEGTAPNTRIDIRGCPLGNEIPLPRVVFASGDATLNRRASRSLDELIVTLELHPTLTIEVAGFTDSRGDPDRNRSLSQRRADAVRKYVISGGVAARRVRSRGYGAADPIGDNETAWGRALNRRVLVRVLTL